MPITCRLPMQKMNVSVAHYRICRAVCIARDIKSVMRKEHMQKMKMVISEIEKLKSYGFKPNGNYNNLGQIWTLDVYDGEGQEIYLCVNPLGATVENEIAFVLNVTIDEKELRSMERGYDVEHILPLDIIYQMIADGVLVPASTKEAAA